MFSDLRKLFYVAFSFALVQHASAQNEQNAIMYSTISGGNSARVLGMGGSFSSIGVDAAAAMINPAGIALARRNEFNFGVQFMNVRSNATYLGEQTRDGKFNFNIPNLNLVIADVKYDANGKPKKKGLAGITYGFNINRHTGFHSRTSFEAINRQSSITDYFADNANSQNSLPENLLTGSLASIAASTGAIENLLDQFGNNTEYYVSRYVDSNRNNKQIGSVENKGNIYEYQFTAGANFSHKLYLGLGLFYTSLNFSEIMDFREEDGATRKFPDLASLDYQMKYIDRGSGFGARLGAIFRPNDQFRLSFAMHTPRSFTINEEYGYSITTTFEQGANFQKEVTAYTDPLNTYKYKVVTPARFVAGVGFVLNKFAIFSAEIDMYDYTTARMSASDYGFVAENNNIRRNYQNVVNVRLGAELNFPDPDDKEMAYRLRFGYANYPSVFSSRTAGIDPILKKSNNVLSAGFGFRDRDYYVDFALSYGTSSNYYTPYVTNSGLFPVSSITNKQNRVGLTFTMGFNFE